MSRPALLDKLFQAGKWLLKPGLVPVDDVTIKRNQTAVYVALDALIRQGGGLAVGSDKRIYVDFSLMPTDAFEELLKSIRVPIWLTGHKNFYVNGEVGSDTLDEGRGLTEDKPFASLQAALNHVSDTYNLGKYALTIILADGDYGNSSIQLPSYTTSSGRITIRGKTTNAENVKIGRVFINTPAEYYIDHLTIKPASPSKGALYVCDCQNGTVNLRNVIFDLREVEPLIDQPYRTLCARGGIIRIPSTNTEEPTGIKILPHSTRSFTPLYASVGTISFIADITLDGDMSVLGAFAYATNGGNIQRGWYNDSNPGRLPIVTATGQVTGKRYLASMNGVIDSYRGGDEFFPGSAAGTVETGGQYG